MKDAFLHRFSKHHWLVIPVILGLFVGFVPRTAGYAQQPPPAGPIYIVQEGDSLWGIAARFDVSVVELQKANGIVDPNQLKVADQLVIPGLEGIEGVIGTSEVRFGDTVRGLERYYQIPNEVFIRMNRLTSPTDLYAGATIILPEQGNDQTKPGRAALQTGQTVLELAILNGSSLWGLVNRNKLNDTWSSIPGDILSTPSGSGGPGGLPEWIGRIDIEPLSLLQGKTALISVTADGSIALTGSLLERELHFFDNPGAGKVALQGVHAMTEPGLYPLDIQGRTPTGNSFSFEQMAPVKAVDYPYDQPLTVDPATIDPTVTKPEEAQWSALAAPVTPKKYWNGEFSLPSSLDKDYCLQSGDCWASRYGNRRSYNGSAYLYFHTGLDVVGKTGTEIYAPADGVVVFTGPLTVRGNATMIDHGQGVYTGYMHQSEILVKPGDLVTAGQLIGKIGGTGRVQGPHLHWEVWVGGVQIDPLDWLERAYP